MTPPLSARGEARVLHPSWNRRETPAWVQARLYLAPVVVTPTKPLTPSHVKGLLWLDVLFKATRLLRPTTYTNNRRIWDVVLQTVGFWAYLDEAHAGTDYSTVSELWVGERYTEFHRSQPLGLDRIEPYRRRIENEGWLHPSGVQVLKQWQTYYSALGLFDPGLFQQRSIECSLDHVLASLQARDVLLDCRALRSGVFADLTAHGIPLRQLVDEAGVENYLVCILRELLPQSEACDQLLLLADEQLDQDYLILERLLSGARATVQRLTLGRVPIDGQVASSRQGGWQAFTLDKLIAEYLPRYGSSAFRLGMRLYFIAALGRSSSKSFSHSELDHVMQHAARQLERHPPRGEGEALQSLLLENTTRSGYVDPYRLATRLMANRSSPNVDVLLPLFIS